MREALVALTAVLLLIPAVAKAQNDPPIADAGPDQAVFVGDFVQLDGTGSYDPDGDPIVLYMWGMDSIPVGSGAVIASPFSATPAFTPDVEGDYVLSLIVSDGLLESVADTVQVTATINQPPTATAVTDVVDGPVPLTVSFDGTASFDPEGGALYARWSFGDSSLPVEDIQAVHTYTTPGSYEAILTVVDPQGLVDNDSITITVEEPPPAWGEASVVGMKPESPSKGLNCLLALLTPIGVVLLLKRLR